MKQSVTFYSTMFEDDEYDADGNFIDIVGKTLASWLAEKLPEHGIAVEQIFEEDWGWMVIIHWKPYLLSISCTFWDGDVWLCIPNAEYGYLARLFKKFDTIMDLAKLVDALEAVLISDPNISQIQWHEGKSPARTES